MSSAGFNLLLSHRARRATRTLHWITVPQGTACPPRNITSYYTRRLNITTYRGRDVQPPDIRPNSTYRRHFSFAQNSAYSSRTGRYSAASGGLRENHRNQPIALTGKAKHPRCFRLGRPPVHSFDNDTTWSNSETFKKWFNSLLYTSDALAPPKKWLC